VTLKNNGGNTIKFSYLKFNSTLVNYYFVTFSTYTHNISTSNSTHFLTSDSVSFSLDSVSRHSLSTKFCYESCPCWFPLWVCVCLFEWIWSFYKTFVQISVDTMLLWSFSQIPCWFPYDLVALSCATLLILSCTTVMDGFFFG
jgi:hypothetical protein